MPWFRFYHEVLDDPKIQGLPVELRWQWVELLCIAARNNGKLPPIETVAFHLRRDVSAAQAVVERLVSAGLIEVRCGGADGKHYAPYRWEKRQYKSDTSTERVKRFRSVSETLGETPPDTDTDIDTEYIKKLPKKAAGKPAGVRGEIEADFTEFWAAYPRKEGKLAALKAYAKARQSVDKPRLHEAAVAYANRRAAEDPKFTPHAATWLNRGSWEDIPPTAPVAAERRVHTEQEAAVLYEKFWAVFPRKDFKESAFPVYREVLKRAPPEEVEQAAKAYAERVAQITGYPVSHANSWLMETFISKRGNLVDNKPSTWKKSAASFA